LFFFSCSQYKTKKENFSSKIQQPKILEQTKLQKSTTIEVKKNKIKKSINLKVKKPIRRGGKKSTKNSKSMTIIGTNAAGLLNKKESLLRNVKVFNPGVILIQETKAKRKNKIKLENYVTFEYVRKDRGGGGLLTAIHKNLKPVSIGSDDDNEVIVVEADVGRNRA
jgi:hypothetical protein